MLSVVTLSMMFFSSVVTFKISKEYFADINFFCTKLFSIKNESFDQTLLSNLVDNDQTLFRMHNSTQSTIQAIEKYF